MQGRAAGQWQVKSHQPVWGQASETREGAGWPCRESEEAWPRAGIGAQLPNQETEASPMNVRVGKQSAAWLVTGDHGGGATL